MLRSRSDDSTDSEQDHRPEARQRKIVRRAGKRSSRYRKKPTLPVSPSSKSRRRQSRTRDPTSSQEYLSAVSTTGECTPETGSPPGPATSHSTLSRPTTTATTSTSKICHDLSPGASMVAQGPSRDLQKVALSLAEEFSDSTSPGTTYHEPIQSPGHVWVPPMQREHRGSFPADRSPSHQLSFFQGRDRSHMRTLRRFSGERKADSSTPPASNVPQFLGISKSISEGNLLYVRPAERKRRRKATDSLPLALARKDAMKRRLPTRTPAAVAKIPEPTTTDDTLPTSLIVEYDELKVMKPIESERSLALRFETPTRRSTTTSIALFLTTDTTSQILKDDEKTIKEEPAWETSLTKDSVATERSKRDSDSMPVPKPRRISMATSEGDRTEWDDDVPAPVPTTPHDLRDAIPFLSHWQKVFDARGLETAADDPSSGEQYTASVDRSLRTSAATRRDAPPRTTSGKESERAPVAIKEEATAVPFLPTQIAATDLAQTFEGDHRTKRTEMAKKRRNERRSSNVKSLNANRKLRRTIAMDDLRQATRELASKFPGEEIGDRGAATQMGSENKKKEDEFEVQDNDGRFPKGQARTRSTYSGMQEFDPSHVAAKKAVVAVEDEHARGSTGTREERTVEDRHSGWDMTGVAHPSRRSVVHKYLKSPYVYFFSSNSERAGQESSSSSKSTTRKEFYKGYLHAGKLLPTLEREAAPTTALRKLDELPEPSPRVRKLDELPEPSPRDRALSADELSRRSIEPWSKAEMTSFSVEPVGELIERKKEELVRKDVQDESGLGTRVSSEKLIIAKEVAQAVQPLQTALDSLAPERKKSKSRESEEEEYEFALPIEYPPVGSGYDSLRSHSPSVHDTLEPKEADRDLARGAMGEQEKGVGPAPPFFLPESSERSKEVLDTSERSDKISKSRYPAEEPKSAGLKPVSATTYKTELKKVDVATKEDKKTDSEKSVKPADSQASLVVLAAKPKAEAVIVPPKKEEPSKPPKKSEVSVKVSYVKPKKNEAYYVAILQIRTIPLLLLLGNIVVLILLLIASYFGLFWWLDIGPKYPTTTKGLGVVCRSVRCGIAGSTLYYALNHKIEPCDSMYEFVCERWIHEPSSKYQRVVLGAEKHLLEESYKDMRDIFLSSRLLSHGSTALVKVAMLYRGCLNKNSSNLNHLTLLKKEYGLDGWPFFTNFSGSVETVLANFIRNTGSGALVSVRIISDPKSPSQPPNKLIALECSTFTVPLDTLLKNRDTQKEIIKVYKNLIMQAVEEIREVGKDKIVNQIFSFEVNLAGKCKRDCLHIPLKKVKIQELSGTPVNSSEMNWVAFLQRLFEYTQHGITPDTEILVRSVAYLRKLGTLFHDPKARVRLINYIGWRFMAKFARHASSSYEENFNKFETAVGREVFPNWKRCLMDTAEVMPFAVGRLYAELKQWEATDFKVHELVLNLISSLNHMLHEFKWIQGTTKQQVKSIVSKASIAVGYPYWIMNDTVLDTYYNTIPRSGIYLNLYQSALKNRFIQRLNMSHPYDKIPSKMAHFIFPTKTVELHQRSGVLRETLFYDIRENTFAVPSGVFSAPYYNPHLTWAMNYGGLGIMIARDVIREFFHAIDAGWMTDTDRNVYKNGSQCVLRAVGTRSKTTPDATLMHCGGLVRSLLALRLTYNAYHVHLGVQEGATLPGLEDLSPDQVFFVAALRTLCTQIREQHFVPVVQLKQSVTELDYLDALMRGMNEFTDAFNCGGLRDSPNVFQQCFAYSSSTPRLKSRKRALWHPPVVTVTTPANPVLTTERRAAYRRNRTVLNRPYSRI